MSDDGVNSLPQYRSHKIVRAAEILDWASDFPAHMRVRVVTPNGEPHTIKAKSNIFARGEPQVGDYLVIYDDGYISWSPRGPFEEGYTIMVEEKPPGPGGSTYRAKPVMIEAHQWNRPGDHPAVEPIARHGFADAYVVRGKQGEVRVEPGDWIIAEPDGSGFYPCKPDVFAAKYERA